MLEPAELNLRHLDALLAAHRLGSITAAAQAVNLSQPTVSQALAKLETQLACRLLDRQPGGVRSTRAGNLLAGRVERALGFLGESCRAVRRTAKLTPLAFPERHVGMTQLRAFLTVERSGSFVAAARSLGLSEPSVHRAARELELVVGTPLLVRMGQTMRCTRAGAQLAQGARLALAELRAGLDEVVALRADGAGRVVIGTLPLPGAGLLPLALARFAERQPRATIQLVEAPYSELLASLQAGEIDLLFGALRIADAPPGVRQQALFDDELFIVGRSGHPLVDGDRTNADLARYPWVVGPPGAPMRHVWDSLFVATEPPERQIQCGSMLAARGLLLAGDWLALMSPDQFRLEQAADLLSPIGAAVPHSRRQIGLTTRDDWAPTLTQTAFLEVLRAVVSERV